MSDLRKIWVIAGRDGYTVGDETHELLTEANSLVQAGNCIISTFIFGSNLDQQIRELEQSGLTNYVYVFESSQFKSYNPYIYLKILQTIYPDQRPFLILVAGTSMGKDLAPRLAYHLDGGFISNIQQIKFNNSGELEAVKPIYGGKIHGIFRFTGSPPWIATVIPGVVGVEKTKEPRKATFIRINNINEYVEKSPNRYRVIGFIKADPETMDLSEADIVVAGGKGVKGPKVFQLLTEFANQIGAVIGCTRPIVDQGILTLERQIGQTGKTVNPNLFISCGISGAIQHEMGMRDSKEIIAINIDPQAQVFRISDLKVITDVNEILPILIEIIKEHKKQIAA